MTNAANLLPAVEAIYDAATDPLQWPKALGAIADLFGDEGALIEWRTDSTTYGVVVSESLAEANRDFAENNWSKHNFKGDRGVERGLYFSGLPLTDRHLCTEEEMIAHPFCKDFLFKHNLGRFGGVGISPDPNVGVILSIQRSFADKPAFSDDELALIGTIGRHMERSLRLSIRLLDAELVNLGLGDALARIGIGVFALDPAGRVLFSNPEAQRIPNDVVAIVQDRLILGPGEARHSFEAAVAGMGRGNSTGLDPERKPILLESAASDRRFVIYLLPVASSKLLAETLLTQNSVIVLVIEQKANEPADPAAVRDVLGLTLGEARVASLIGSGLPTKETARRLGIADETARSHLKNVFAKVGVSRQSELAALLAKLMLR